MTRSEITVNELNRAWAERETPDAIAKSDGHIIAAASDFEKMIILVHISAGTGTGGDVTIKAGTEAPAFRRGLGDLAIGADLVADDEYVIGPIETARFLQADGSIHIDITDTSNTNIAGTLEVYSL